MQHDGSLLTADRYDAVLVGAGIMSATLAALLHELDPGLRLLLVERLEAPALESSGAGNNAGTGHAANCELNYTPRQADGTVATAKAVAINAAFERSLEFWGSLSERGQLNAQTFLHQAAHISAVWTEENIAFLRQRFSQLRELPAFAAMRWSEEPAELMEWMPLVMAGRDLKQPVAATRIERGTDVDFGALTRAYLLPLQASGALTVQYGCEVRDLKRLRKSDMTEADWQLILKGPSGRREVRAPFVFLGAGGGALPLLQRSGIPEAADFAGFPVSGLWLVCGDGQLADKQLAKVYGKAAVGAPPMSVPHLDTRWIDGRRSLLFGPFAGFSSKFLKQGSLLDLPGSVRATNLLPMLQVGATNIDLVRYLINQLRQSPEQRHEALQQFMPTARAQDWTLSVAGQRVQIIKRSKQGGRLQLGTEVVASSDGSLAALLGASPGASTAVTIMLEVLERCFPQRLASEHWQQRLQALLPSYGEDPIADPAVLQSMRQRSNSLLDLKA
ncbi:MAG: malate:quinone oxidoreductase [Synechococcus sp. BS301-5m-G54]|uniref:malate:quinone oxidoreductase n=1 Tax=Synechococcus sp. KORDI-49 TaxID=585423 RepID=UPI0004E0A0A3|nr:malate:quinone oxidoreductase [Synechococcus sp. KORDI-49]AII47319.1 malate:quinone oxidoreductase [Synechococcus sp. KORDI-49]MBL6738726.1 malate:quinone oxidoreductase [Synechococcus sp. BS301-5m-G54]MBL6795040.1 malate:quinone oxidoreductase [Synechococcus sp. BS307-5m-G34]